MTAIIEHDTATRAMCRDIRAIACRARLRRPDPAATAEALAASIAETNALITECRTGRMPAIGELLSLP